MTKVIAFDFDGVFVRDSDEVFKNDAWTIVFEPYTGQYENFFEEAKTMFGYGKPGGRKEILEHVYRKLGLSEDQIKDSVEKSAEKFNEYVQSKIKEAGLVEGVIDALEALKENGARMYLNSGTASDALEESTEALGIRDFFSGIFGSTDGGKVDNLKTIIEIEGISKDEMLVVGDGESDIKAAEDVGCNFVGFANKWNNWDKDSDINFEFVTNFDEIKLL